MHHLYIVVGIQYRHRHQQHSQSSSSTTDVILPEIVNENEEEDSKEHKNRDLSITRNLPPHNSQDVTAEEEKENSEVNHNREPSKEPRSRASKSKSYRHRRKLTSQDCRKTPSNGLSLEPQSFSSSLYSLFDSITPNVIISDSVIDFSRSAKYTRTGYESLSRLSLPSQLQILELNSSPAKKDPEDEEEEDIYPHPSNGYGVITQVGIEKHSRFGPLIGDQIQEVDINKDTDFQHLWKILENLYISTLDPETSNWFRYLRPAPSKASCNCVFLSDPLNHKGYLITTQDIRLGEELLFWTDWAWNDEEFHKIPMKTNCGGCNLSFVHVLHYALHIKSLHDPRYSLTIRKYHCKICAIGILGKENFVSHLSNLHRGQGGHQCQYCKKIFPSTVVSGNAS
ncbi:unnamed protein product [Lepeophtheirus salmonis]|uniref:(salmon louse) hypothetical protein n=1 Tax=Lepeophtheirus salmonis TaxID=72036 RepID=A0A7R8CE05_LEPSM|nr:unnamed protein product [Lepeophtheirus salmonis]CAF2780598.1 unnamed protein product [Lepeophtheirus salmonis]